VLDADDEDEDEDEEEEEEEEDEESEDPPESPARFFFPLFLKSVSYQPPPFRRNPAALILRRSSSLPHCGHRLRGASDSFCNFSSSWLQDWHWYS